MRLVDARPSVGGGILDLLRNRGRERFGLLIADLEAELAASGVEVRLGRRIDARDAIDFAPDAIVLATGAQPDPATRLRLDGVRVLDSLDVLRDPALAGERCVVFDETGTWEASGIVEQLAAAGVDVHLVSPTAAYAGRITVYSRLALAERLGSGGVAVHPLARPVPAGAREVILRPTVGAAADVHIVEVDAVVHVRPLAARSDLLDALEREGFAGAVHLVGDAFAPRTVQEAVYEGRAAGSVVGVADPEIARGLRAREPYLLRGDLP